MVLKMLSGTRLSIEGVSTGLTYIALTSIVIAPIVTAKPRLPPAIEAREHAAASQPVQSALTAEALAVSNGQLANARTQPQPALLTQDAAPSQGELHDLPPAKTLREARARLKAIRARDVKIEPEPEEARSAPVEPVQLAKAENKKPPPKTAEPSAPPPTTKAPAPDASPTDSQAPVTAWNETEINAALKECLRLLAPINVEVEVNSAMRKGECGTAAPILLKSIDTGIKLTFQPAVEINCPMAVAMHEWAKDTLQPAARDTYGSDVTRIVSSSGYSCRNRYGLASERLSEHALANAIDIGGFTLANGRTIKVTTGWGTTQRDAIATAKANEKAAKEAAAAKDPDKTSKTPTIKSDSVPTLAAVKASEAKSKDAKGKSVTVPAEVAAVKISETNGAATDDGRFLRRLHKGACETFGTVLGPEANEAHRDHFHFDLKARKRRAVCQ